MNIFRSLLFFFIICAVFFACFVLFLSKVNKKSISSKSTTTSQKSQTIITTPVEEKNIVVYSPEENQTVEKSFTITGKARVFENVVSLRLTNTRNNKVYVLAVTDAKAPDVGQFGDFRYTINLSQMSLQDVKPQDKLLLEVFQQSPKDGSEVDRVEIPLVFH